MGREVQEKIIQRHVTKYIRRKDNETVTKVLKTLIRLKMKTAGKIQTHHLDSLENAEETGCEHHVIVSRILLHEGRKELLRKFQGLRAK